MSHGVTIEEKPTGVVPPVSSDAGLSVYVGLAPVNRGDETAVNKPILCSTLAEFAASFGDLDLVPSSDWDKWTLHEAASAHFSVYGVGPIVCINVLDPTNIRHTTLYSNLDLAFSGTSKTLTLAHPNGLMSSVIVKVPSLFGPDVLAVLGTDYTLAFDDSGLIVITRLTGAIPADSGAQIKVTYKTLEPEAIHEADIIGGYSAGKYTGLEVVEQVYPKLRLVPGFILAPKWSQEPVVAARMAAIAALINGSFRAVALTDLSTEPYEIASYAEAAAWKSDNGYTSAFQIDTWPKVKNGNDVYHASTHLACIANLTDEGKHSGVPSESPSNKPITATSAVLDDGTEVSLTRLQANLLNDQGIVTVLNGFNGWRLWGNRTGVYPGSTDPKDSFIPVRRMFNYIDNTIILTTDSIVDQPGNKRLIDNVVGTIQSLFNGLIASGDLVNAKIEFRKDENSTTDLSDGKIKFHNTVTPPSPAEDIEFITEYDPSALAALFT